MRRSDRKIYPIARPPIDDKGEASGIQREGSHTSDIPERPFCATFLLSERERN